MPSGNAIWTPDGIKTLGMATPERVELRPAVMEWLRQFADVAQALALGLHCSKCGADLVGKNADTDRAYAITCGCRELIGQNREYRNDVFVPRA